MTTIRALHVFPVFAPGLPNGSDYYQHMLTRELVRRGVEVDVFATCSERVRPTSPFSLRWDHDLPATVTAHDGIRVRRFPASFSLPRFAGHAVTRAILRRWTREERRFGRMLPGSRHVIDHFALRARTRPAYYDWLAMLGRGPWSLRLLAEVARVAPSYDVIVTGFVPFATTWQLTSLARRAGRPVAILALFHPEDPFHHFRTFYRAFERADAILAQTDHSVRVFEQLCPDAKPVRIGAGVDPSEFDRPDVSGPRFRATHGLGTERIVLFVGRKEQGKRWDLAVEAVERLRDPRVRLVLIGADVDRRPLGSSRVLHLPHLKRHTLADAYDACDVLVLPSERESFGLVFLEAWMRGKPVIGSARCGPVTSVIDDGETGFLCHDAEEIAGRLQQLLADPDLARALGERGRRKVLAEHTWDRVGERAHAVYRTLAAGSGEG